MTLRIQSTIRKTPIFSAVLCFFCLFYAVTASYAQEIEVKIQVASIAPAEERVHIEGNLLDAKSSLASADWSFLQNYADASELGARIENLSLFSENGEKIEYKRLIPGEFQANKKAVSFAYDVKAAVPTWFTSMAHISWVSRDGGLLMLNDLLPQWKRKQPISAKVSIKLPAGWNITSSEVAGKDSSFVVENAEKAIFLVGKGWREKTVKIDKTELNLAIAGEWQFTDDEAAEMVNSISEEYRKIFGEMPVPKAQILLLPFLQRSSRTADRWRAETRGATVTILSGIVPYKSQALQRLHEQLRHELFHLWIPNALALSGNYDWFYEGFAVYQALRTGVQVNQIRFDDYLKTLSQAYDMAQNQNISLVKMSGQRWTGANSSVYAKGMVVAFLCDAALLRENKGKRSLSDIFRQLYQKHHRPNPIQDANTAILNILRSYPELLPLVQNYIEGASKVEWRDELNNFGIEYVNNNSVTELKVLPKLSGRQKDLLDKLGYNQWRKLLQKTK